VNALGFSSGRDQIGTSGITTARVDVARALGIGGVAAYNWWVVVPFVPGLMTSHNEFFSDLEVPGLRDADLMQRADLVAGIVLVVALLMRGASGRNGARREWKWLVAFAAAGAIGGRFPYVCSEGLSATCRNLEWHMELPLHHYIHVVSGIAEFVFLTVAVMVAVRRTKGETTRAARAFRVIRDVLIVGYPLLGLVYLTDRLGAFVEPVFFVSFSAMLIVSLFEPVGRPTAPAELEGEVAIAEAPGWDGVRTTGNA
jgi:Protein of unknown function (DUF998)